MDGLASYLEVELADVRFIKDGGWTQQDDSVSANRFRTEFPSTEWN